MMVCLFQLESIVKKGYNMATCHTYGQQQCQQFKHMKYIQTTSTQQLPTHNSIIVNFQN